MGSGKSAVGALVALHARAPFFDLDQMIESQAGMTVAEIFATRGEAGFRALESRLLPGALQAGAVVALGGGTIVDDAGWQLVRQRAISVYLELPFQTIWQRIGRDQARPLIAGRLRKEVEELFERRRARYEQATHRVDGTRTPDEIAAEVEALWSD
jgi:shikimate kinase